MSQKKTNGSSDRKKSRQHSSRIQEKAKQPSVATRKPNAEREKQPKTWLFRVKQKIQALFSDVLSVVDMIKDPKKMAKLSIEERARRISLAGVAILLLVCFLSLIGFGIYTGMTYKNAQKIIVNGQDKAYLWKTELSADDIIKTVESKIEKQLGTTIELTDQITIEDVHAQKKETTTIEILLTDLSRELSYHVSAYQVLIDEKLIAVITDKEAAEAYLDSLVAPFLQDGLNIVESGFQEIIGFTPVFIDKKDIEDIETLKKKLANTTEEQELYEVKRGDTLEAIALGAGMTLSDLLLINPNISVDMILPIGQQLILTLDKPIISVVTKELVEYVAVIEKKVQTVNNNDKYVNYSKVLQQGKNGQEQVKAEIIRINGFEVEKNVLERTVLEEAIPEIIEVGANRIPPKQALGQFIMPTWGRVSEFYEAREGAHKGIDVANVPGTSIKASDGGTVIQAEFINGYGYTILIDHHNGFQTRYAHCAQLFVATGTDVAQGQVIAHMGSTGKSTGSHLHFEIIRQDERVNPFLFIE